MSELRLKDATRINRLTLPENTDPGYSFKYIDIGSVNGFGQISMPDDLVTFGSCPTRARRLAVPGSTIVSTVRTYLRAVAQVPQNESRLVFSTGFAVLEPCEDVDPRYLSYYCQSEKFIGEVVARSTGVSYPAINASEIGDLRISLPALDEQRRIARFLDVETKRLDVLAQARSRAIELISTRYKAVIRQALSQGLAVDGEVSSDGSIPWLTTYPAHWSAVPIRYLARVQRGASPRPIDDPIYFDDDGTHGWVRIADVTASNKYLTVTTQKLSTLGKSLSVPLSPGELFVSIAGSIGKPIIADMHCCIHDGFVAIRNAQVDSEYLYYVLLLGDAFRGLGKLGTQLNLNSETIGSIKIPVPPATEQARVVEYLNTEFDRMNNLESAIATQVELIFERRAAVVTAAVTGQFDVAAAEGGDAS